MIPYEAGDSFSYSVEKTEGDLKPSEGFIDLSFFTDGGFMVLEIRYNARLSPGESPSALVSTSRDFYHLLDGDFVLEKSVEYPSSGGSHTTYVYEPGIVELRFPLEVGASWSGESELSARQLNKLMYNLNVKFKSIVTGFKQIETEAGVFNCFEIETTREDFLGEKLIKTTLKKSYHCEGKKHYPMWIWDTTLPSGRKTGEINIKQYKTTLELQEEHGKAALREYRA
jgi:hypothetical protein